MNPKDAPTVIKRPLSPFMLGSAYRLQLTSVLSFAHRLTGLALVAGTIPLLLWLWAAAYDADGFDDISGFFSGIFGRILLFGWSLAFYYHLCNGVRHLFWDMGKGFEIHTAYRNGYIVLGATAVLTIGTWIMLLTGGGQ